MLGFSRPHNIIIGYLFATLWTTCHRVLYHLYHPPLFHISSPTHNPHGNPFALPLPILSSSTSRPARNSGRRKSPTTLRMLSSNIRPATPTSLTGPETCNLGEQSLANALDVHVSRRRRSPLRRMLFLPSTTSSACLAVCGTCHLRHNLKSIL